MYMKIGYGGREFVREREREKERLSPAFTHTHTQEGENIITRRVCVSSECRHHMLVVEIVKVILR
jgi:GTP cyclohydrolase I